MSGVYVRSVYEECSSGVHHVPAHPWAALFRSSGRDP
jgi:hypothetical protein